MTNNNKNEREELAPLQTIDEHRCEIEEIVNRYGSSFNPDMPFKSQGLSDAQVEGSRSLHGSNQLPTPREVPLWLQYLGFLRNLFSVMLFVAGALTLVIYILKPSNFVNLYAGLIFWAVAFFNAGLEFYQSYKSQQVLAGFKALVPSSCTVIRNGSLTGVQAGDIVVGDLIFCKAGDKIPADGRIVYSSAAKVDNSSLTGESEPLDRSTRTAAHDVGPSEASNLVFSGTNLVDGEILAIIIRVGRSSVVGRILEQATKEKDVYSPLEAEIEVTIRRIVLSAVITASLFLAAGFISGLDVTFALDAAVGILIAFLPQGLPATITILLTVAAKRMAKRNVLVKDLRAVETLGSITVMASDKTGTLTQNKMTVDGAWIDGQIIDHCDIYKLPCDLSGSWRNLISNASLCSRAKMDESDQQVLIGDATEVGILQFCQKFILRIRAWQEEHPKLAEIPFNSERKWQMSVHQMMSSEGGQLKLYIKGAPEKVLAMCSRYIGEGEKTFEIDQVFRDAFDQAYEHFAASGRRILAFAERSIESLDASVDLESLAKDLNFIGLLALVDPPKHGVAEAVLTMKGAGIKVFMVTGDHPLTARAIAAEVNIISNPSAARIYEPSFEDPNCQGLIIHGQYLDDLTETQWDSILGVPELVFARTLPRNKLAIVRNLQRLGHVVGMSGDGVNDSPALRTADLGISMNLTGSDMSKDAAALILLDDNFTSILAGIIEGRLIFENLKKSIRYTMTHIMPEIAGIASCVLLLIPLPITPLLILMIDVGADVGPALSFAREPPEYPKEKIMTFPPRKKASPRGPRRRFDRVLGPFRMGFSGESLVDRDLLGWVYFQGGIVLCLGSFGAYLVVFWVRKVPFSQLWRTAESLYYPEAPPFALSDGTIIGGTEQTAILNEAQAAYFLAIIIGQWFNLFCTKHRYRYPFGLDLFINPWTYVGIFASAVEAVLVVYIPTINSKVFHTEPVTPLALIPPIIAGMLLLIYEFIRKFFQHRHYRHKTLRNLQL